MLKALLIVSDPKVRDIIRTGLDQFQVFAVEDAGDGGGVDMAHDKPYDLTVVDLELQGQVDGMTAIRRIREFDQNTEIVLVTRGKSSRLLSKEKALSNIFALLPLPIEELAFFKLFTRARDRIQSKQ